MYWGRTSATPDRARLVTRRLLGKAATRLRRMDCRAGHLLLNVKGEGTRGEKGARWAHGVRLPHVMDSFTMLAALDGLWARMLAELPEHRFLQVGVVLSELSEGRAVQLGLFDPGAALDEKLETKRLALSHAMDKVNNRFGRDAVTVGHDASGATRSSGPRIAFTRIPELAEFNE